jgi:hypothetical protein
VVKKAQPSAQDAMELGWSVMVDRWQEAMWKLLWIGLSEMWCLSREGMALIDRYVL